MDTTGVWDVRIIHTFTCWELWQAEFTAILLAHYVADMYGSTSAMYN